MDNKEAQRVIDALRYGVPPEGYVRYFTVGRLTEIDQLTNRLRQPQPGALLLKANYGSGKTHLLRFIREEALAQNYAVSSVTLDASSAVRFNRMDQIMAAVWRGLEVPGKDKRRGVRPFLDVITHRIEESRTRVDQNAVFWHKVTNYSRWDYSTVLKSPALFIALRAWATYRPEACELVEAWFSQPWNYKLQRKKLYEDLILKLRTYFRDPRSERKFYNLDEGIFHFQQQDYTQSWGVLRDIQSMSVAAGFKGFIILFDEFEDVLYNMRNIGHQQAAFRNLFQFYAGDVFPSMTFFAVTPGFVQKCKERLLEKNAWDYDFERFGAVPTFEMSPLSTDDLHEVALKIRHTYAIAYGLEAEIVRSIDLRTIVARASVSPIEDRARHTIREVVGALDNAHDEVA